MDRDEVIQLIVELYERMTKEQRIKAFEIILEVQNETSTEEETE